MRRTPHHHRRGSISVIAVIAIVLLSARAAAILSVMTSHRQEVSTAGDEIRAFYAAEAGANEMLAIARTTVANLPAGQRLGDLQLPVSGTKVAPCDFSGGAYHGQVADNADDTYTIPSVGSHKNSRAGVEVVISSGGERSLLERRLRGQLLRRPRLRHGVRG